MARLLMATSFLFLAPFLALPALFPESAAELATPAKIGALFVAAGFSVITGTIAVLAYHASVRSLITPYPHPDRHKLVRLTPLLFAIPLLGLAGMAPLASLAILGCASLASIRITGKRLFWEAVHAGISTGILYGLAAALSYRFLPSFADDLWFTQSGFGATVLGIPLAHVGSLALLGLITGPLYLALKEAPTNRISGPHAASPVAFKVAGALAVLALLVGAGGWASYAYGLKPQAVSSQIPLANLALNAGLDIELNRPLDRASVRLSIEPPVSGQWEFKETSVRGRFFKRLGFIPDGTLEPGREYAVTIRGGNPLKPDESVALAFSTEPLPEIVGITPKEGAIAPCAPITATFARDLSSYWEPAFSITPSADLKVKREGASYELAPATCLEQGTSYAFEAGVRHPEAEDVTPLAKASFATPTAPGIASHAPTGDAVSPLTTVISLGFTKAMKPEGSNEYLSVNPNLAGSWSWNAEGTVATYAVTERLAPSTRYTVTAKRGMQEVAGGFLPEDASASFSTVGPPSVSSISPSAGSSGIDPNASIKIRFSQPVDRQSAQDRFSIDPPVAGTFSWSGNDLTFKPSTGLAYSTSYSYSMAAGVTSPHGLATAKATLATFTVKAAPPPPPQVLSFGHSESGRVISGYVFGNGPRKVFLFGAIHGGKEKSSGLLMERFVQELNRDTSVISKDKTVIIIPVTNPDGYYGRTDKLNSREVNLNLNFDTGDWQQYGGDLGHFAGEAPFSESESRVIRDVVNRYKPESMLSFHAIGPLVNPESYPASQALARWYAQRTGYPYFEDPSWDYFGTATRWYAERYDGGAITIELASYTVADWNRHKDALFELVR